MLTQLTSIWNTIGWKGASVIVSFIGVIVAIYLSKEANRKSQLALDGQEADRVYSLKIEHASSDISSAINEWTFILNIGIPNIVESYLKDNIFFENEIKQEYGPVQLRRNVHKADSIIQPLYSYYDRIFTSYKFQGLSKKAVIELCKNIEYQSLMKYGIFYLKTNPQYELLYQESLIGLAKITESEIWNP